MPRSYAVTWQESTGSPHSGKLEVRPRGVTLEGRGGGALLVRYADLVGIEVATLPERLTGRPTLVLDRNGEPPIRIAGVGGPGIIREVAEKVAAMRGEPAIVTDRAAVVVSLQAEKRDAVEQLLAKGPPFDPEEAELERHEVFIGDNEAIFIFEGLSNAGLQRLLTDPSVWASAAAWHEVVAGPPRIAKSLFTWEAVHEPEDLFFGPTPGPGDSDGGDVYPP